MSQSDDSITLRDCLDLMDAGIIFSIQVVQHDERRERNNGKILKYDSVMLLKRDNPDNVESKTNDNAIVQLSTKLQKKPAHRRHSTRNIRLCIGKIPTSTIVKIHIDLMLRLNGRKVILP